MNCRKISLLWSMVPILFLLVSTATEAQSYHILYTFDDQDGPSPLTLDSNGNLFGVTAQGGFYQCYENYYCGTIFELTPAGEGNWDYNVLHYFTGGADGGWPGGPLAIDRFGNLYGPTAWQNGTAFQLGRIGRGWSFSTIYNSDTSALVLNGGRLYAGAAVGFITLGQISISTWHATILNPTGNIGFLTFDPEGNAYGTTQTGGSGSAGSVYKLRPNSGSFGWTYSTIYSFQFGGAGGYQPLGGVAIDAAGNLYGTTIYGGSGGCHGGCGVLFKLSPNPDGTWGETVIHQFQGGTNDGSGPNGPPTLDSAGNVYVATAAGGTNGFGFVFKFTPGAGGQWTQTILHSFSGNDGTNPAGGMVFDAAGNLYGVTSGNLRGGASVAFGITP